MCCPPSLPLLIVGDNKDVAVVSVVRETAPLFDYRAAMSEFNCFVPRQPSNRIAELALSSLRDNCSNLLHHQVHLQDESGVP